MSHSIPVFYFPIDKHELPHSMESWHSVENMLGERWEKRNEYKLRSFTSRNWWFQYSLGIICDSLEIKGLEFIRSEIVCLDHNELQIATIALDEVLNRIKDGIPKLSPKAKKEGSIWGLRYYFKDKRTKKFSPREYRRAFEEAQPVYEISGGDIGYESVVDFYCFIKSLQDVVKDCLTEGKCLLCVQPQP